MKSFFLLLLSLVCCNKFFAQQPTVYWQQQVNYNIAVSLNTSNHSLDAVETIEYINNSPDTLKFIWFHVWMNAFKNDKTEFSEHLLKHDRTDFYFAEDSMRGYINRLDFKVDNLIAAIEPHPKHIDIIKLWLPKPLPPKASAIIKTPFKVKLPYCFSQSGHVLHNYQISNWYPKPAVYDADGWHAMPYLDGCGTYSNFGNFEVNITLPEEYLVAATGELQTTSELNLLKMLGKIPVAKQINYSQPEEVAMKKTFLPAKPVKKTYPYKSKTKTTNNTNVAAVTATKPAVAKTKTLVYKQTNVTDFAWFASKRFLVMYDTLQMDNRTIDCFSFFYKKNAEQCSRIGAAGIKSFIKKYSKWLGNYPYNTASIVVDNQPKFDKVAYPTIGYINTPDKQVCINPLMCELIGSNWLGNALATDAREHAWLTEGLNRFFLEKWSDDTSMKLKKDFLVGRTVVGNANAIDKDYDAIFELFYKINKAMPLDTNTAAFSNFYKYIWLGERATYFMQHLQDVLSKKVFDSCVKTYCTEWMFKHPQARNIKEVCEKVSGKNLDAEFAKVNDGKPFYASVAKTIKPSVSISPLSVTNLKKHQYIKFLPAATCNFYDGIRLGALLHNYQLSFPKLQFAINPSYGTSSKLFNFFGTATYNIYKKNYWLQLGVSYQKYTYDNFVSDEGNKYQLGINRFVPSVKLTLYNNDVSSKARTVVGFKTFYLKQQNLLFGDNSITTPSTKSYINRLYITKFDNRVLYPYQVNFTLDQGEDFVRAAITGKEFFNYAKHKGGIEARLFAGKFIYLNGKSIIKQYNNDRYHLNLSGPKGYEDYTYSDYFVARGEFEGWKSQQIMERDGFFKARTDYLSSKIGKTDDWLLALNVNFDCPGFPMLKAFADVGTYAEAWKENPATGRFLFDAGVQLSLFKNTINIYAPVLFSKVYRDYNKSILVDNIFQKTISFSINLQNIHFNKLFKELPL